MSQFELPVGTLDPALSSLARHLRIASDFPEAGSEGHVLVSSGPDAAARFLPSGTAPPNLHVLATTTGLGAQHSVTGLSAGQVLRASGASTAQFQRLTAADIDPGTFPTGNYTFGGNTTFQGQVTMSGGATISPPLPKASLPAAIAYEDEANTFTLLQTFSGQVNVNPGPLVVGPTDPGGPEALRVGGDIRARSLGLGVAAHGSDGQLGLAGVLSQIRFDPRSGTKSWILYNTAGAFRFYDVEVGADKMLLTTAAVTPATAGGITTGSLILPFSKGFFGSAAHSADTGAPIQVRTSSWAATWQHDFADRYFKIDSTTGSVRFHHGTAANVDSRSLLQIQGATDTLVETVGADFKIGSLGRFDSTDTPTEREFLLYNATDAKWRAETVQFTFGNSDIKNTVSGDNTTQTYIFNDPGTGADSPVGAPPAAVLKVYPAHKSITVVALANSSGDPYVKPADMRRFQFQWSTDNFGSVAGTILTTSEKFVHGRLTPGTTYYYRVLAEDRAGNLSANSTVVSTTPKDSEVSAFGVIIAAEIGVVSLSAINGSIGDIVAGQMRNQANTAGVFVDAWPGGSAPPSAWKTYLDLLNGVLVVTDNQGSPVTRAKFGKVGAGASDYGVQVWDQAGATIMDFTGAKRILAIPIAAFTDSGSSMTVDLSTGLTQQIRLTASAPAITLSNPTNGARYRLWLQQDTVAGRAFPVFKNANGDEIVMFTNDTAPVLTTGTPGAMDLFELEYRTSPTNRFSCMTLQANVLLPTPIVDSVTATSVSVASTNHNISMPATVNAGDLLLMFITYHAAQGAVTTPSGWTSHGTTGLLSVFSKAADGTEDGTTVNVVTVNSVKAGAHVYRMHRWLGTTAGVEISLGSGAPGTSSDPGTLTPTWGADRTLWIAGTSVTGNPAITDPANYANFNETGDGASTCKVRTGRRILYATSENPGAFTWAGSQSWTSITVAVRPPA